LHSLFCADHLPEGHHVPTHTQRRTLKQELLGIIALIVVACAAPTVLPNAAETIPELVAPVVTAWMNAGQP
jgi:hypothetical protein